MNFVSVTPKFAAMTPKTRMPIRRFLVLALLLVAPTRGMAFNLQFTLVDNALGFTPTQRALVQEAVDRAEAMWETVLRGYQPGITIPVVPITVIPTTSGLASATFSSTTNQGGFTLTTSGFVNINVNEIVNFSNWQGPGANGLNFLDELIAHEVGHALGIGTLWTANGVYSGNFQYTGQYGVAAYQAEFDPLATFVPVENAGGPGTPHSHWDQMMRSSGEAGDPNGPGGPWVLSPLTGVVDPWGRDRAFELMTGAIDPDHIEPFVSRTTVQSMRDLGYLVNEFEDVNGDGVIDHLDRDVILANMGAMGLQVDSMRFGDVNRDRTVDHIDLALWRAAAGVPEPGTTILALLAATGLLVRRKSSAPGSARGSV